MVKDPKKRNLNRKIDRQKKARMRQNEKLLSDHRDPSALASVKSHTEKITELKRNKRA